ncbi:Acid sphingomyelinase-like phosphodiesterase 3b [Clonorchis sinensis]|uniref:Acid sphingomyelinase-like phosphodiesterase 3b n=1 Tax=Clonorchis sinensis TaxID=79923 RepID=A0A3R7F2S1_CLOSI|nr:Acid sphingomyelinase-like phosphodiesterase 3b [Clonorchis sinensis]
MAARNFLFLWAVSTVGTTAYAHDGSDIGFFWQLTDLHLDLWYNLTQDCQGRYGNPKCDSPLDLVQSAVSVTKTLPMLESDYRQLPDFVIWSGDNGPHAGHFTRDQLYQTIQVVSDQMQRVFRTDKVYVLPVLGNHDVTPANHLSPDPLDADRLAWCHNLSSNPLLWGHWIHLANRTSFIDPERSTQRDLPPSPPPPANFSRGCFFSHLLHLPTSELLLVSVNGLVWYRENPLLVHASPDPLQQFDWLNATFAWARSSKCKVLLVSHFPPGASENSPRRFKFLQSGFNKHFVQLLQANADVLMAGLFAHSHVDSFRVLSDQTGHPALSLFTAPSVSPLRLFGLGSFNPRIRLYRYRRSNTTLLGYRQYFLNISQPSPQWQVEYDTSVAYLLSDLSPIRLSQLLNEFEHDDTRDGVWSRYWSHELGGRPHEPSTLMPDGLCPRAQSLCRCEHLCPMRHVDLPAMESCLDSCTRIRPVVLISTNNSVLDQASSNNTAETHVNAHSSLPIIIGVIIAFLAILVGVVLIVNREICRHRGRHARRLAGSGGTIGGIVFTTVNGAYPISLNGEVGGGGSPTDFDHCNSFGGSSTELRTAFHPPHAIGDDHSLSTIHTVDGTPYVLPVKTPKSSMKPNFFGNCEYVTISNFVNEPTNVHSSVASGIYTKPHKVRRPNGILSPPMVISPANRHSHPPHSFRPDTAYDFSPFSHSSQFSVGRSTTREGDSSSCQLAPPSRLVCPTEDYYADDEEGPEAIHDTVAAECESFSDDEEDDVEPFDDGNKPFRLDRTCVSSGKHRLSRDWKFTKRQSMQSYGEPLSPRKHLRGSRGSEPNIQHSHSAVLNGLAELANSVPHSHSTTPYATQSPPHNLTNGQPDVPGRTQQPIITNSVLPSAELKTTGGQHAHEVAQSLTREQAGYEYVRI